MQNAAVATASIAEITGVSAVELQHALDSNQGNFLRAVRSLANRARRHPVARAIRRHPVQTALAVAVASLVVGLVVRGARMNADDELWRTF